MTIVFLGISWNAPEARKFSGWFYGRVNATSHFTGDKIAFIYQDLQTALLGQFDHKVMKAAKSVKVIGCRYDAPKFTHLNVISIIHL